ncbi:hypothetical protein GOD54_23730 [Sinorhizobium medicae]|nr:hypothetical protein [Sinorhizobium medicae]
MALDLTVALQEAELAYHRLVTGQSAVEFRDSNGESVRYTAISARQLQGYILSLKIQLGQAGNIGPMRVIF